jgi:hypothetical protein
LHHTHQRRVDLAGVGGDGEAIVTVVVAIARDLHVEARVVSTNTECDLTAAVGFPMHFVPGWIEWR